jgi:lon-related putative ATP-dependent protease
MSKPSALRPEELCRRCDRAQFAFETTADLEPLDEVLGQKRAIEALEFGIGMAADGYNIYALGPTGLGKHTVARRIIAGQARDEPVPPDWCYVNNFEDSQRPCVLELPPGYARKLRADMEQLVQDLRGALPAAFEGDDYRSRREAIEEEVKHDHAESLEELQKRAAEKGVTLVRTPAGFGVAPTREGKVMSPDEFKTLPAEQRERLEKEVEALQEELQAAMRQLPAVLKEGRKRVRELNREITGFAVGHLIDELREAHAGLDGIQAYLDAVQADVVETAETFLGTEEAGAAPGPAASPASPPPPFERYKVNVLVDHGETAGAPIVFEDHPTYKRLIGDIEHVARMGTLSTDFTLVKPGALHRANGGYLFIEARKLLQQPYAYDALKQSLRARHIRIESLGQALSPVTTRGLEPEPVPLSVKVVLIGDRMLHYMLHQNDPEFGELFKVAADFEERVERNESNDMLYARLIGQVARENEIRPLDAGAVARVLEHGARLADDSERLSVRVESILDLLREADYWSGEADKAVIGAADIQHALDAQRRRANRVQERMEEDIQRGTILIDTEGEAVGQINGLAVLQFGGFAFGKPSRITASVRLGKGEVIDIEREVALGGPIHSKGVLILAGFLGSRYARERPLAISASLVFEQSYSGVDGDSASSTEIYALLSALSGAPVKQSFAVTGSVNQNGEVQAIGGANEKIEGFFDICKGRGLTGDHGVLIPASNVKHLMLRAEVVEAVRDGKFQIYPVETIDQGIELLTGVPAGERDGAGHYPEGTINHMVEARLADFADKARRYAGRDAGEGDDKSP